MDHENLEEDARWLRQQSRMIARFNREESEYLSVERWKRLLVGLFILAVVLVGLLGCSPQPVESPPIAISTISLPPTPIPTPDLVAEEAYADFAVATIEEIGVAFRDINSLSDLVGQDSSNLTNPYWQQEFGIAVDRIQVSAGAMQTYTHVPPRFAEVHALLVEATGLYAEGVGLMKEGVQKGDPQIVQQADGVLREAVDLITRGVEELQALQT